MKASLIPVRLLAEISAIAAVAEIVVVLFALPAIAPQASGWKQALLGATLLSLLAGPGIYWRSMAATRYALRAQRTTPASPLSGPSQGKATRRAAIAMTAAAQLTGLALTAAAVLLQNESIEAEARTRFDRLVERVDADVHRRFLLPSYGLAGIRAAYAAGGAFSRDGFRAWVESRQLAKEFPGLRGFSFVRRVPRDDVDRFVAAERAAGAPDFAVQTTRGDAGDLYVIEMIEPLASNRAALGLDLAAEPVRRAAIERAVASGEVALSEAIRLVQDGNSRNAFLYLLAIYREGSRPATAAQRRDAVVGLVGAPVVLEDLLKGIAATADGLLDLRLEDGPSTARGVPIFVDAPSSADRRPADSARHFETARPVAAGGRELTLRARATPAFEASVDRSSLTVLTLGGALLSFLLALAVWLLAAGRMRAKSLADRMTADLDRLAKVVERTSNAVLITDSARRIDWVNDGFTRLSGYALAEVRGRTPGELLASERTAPAERSRLAEAIASGIGYHGEIANRAKDGSHYWLDLDLQPLHNTRGRINGYMTVATDISELKRVEQALRASEAFLDRAGRVAGIGGWEVDLVAATVVWSDQTRRIHEVDADFQPTMASGIAFYAPEARPAIEAAIQEAIDNGTSFDIEMPLVTAKGRPIWVRAAGEAVRTNGRSVSLFGTFQDVTAKRWMEDELRRNNAAMQSILESLPCGLCVIDADLGIRAHNSQFVELLDLPAALFEGPAPSFESLLRYQAARGDNGAGDDGEARVAELRRDIARRDKQLVEQVRLPAGPTLEVRQAPMPGGGLVTTYTDISERKRAEQAIRDNERFMRIVTDHLPGVVAYWTVDMHCTFANSNHRSWVGRTAEQMIGISLHELLGDAQFRINEPLVRATLRGEEQRVERQRVTADGPTVDYLLHYLPDRDGDTVKGFISVAIDITEQKQAQSQLEALNKALRERTSQAESANVAKSRFLANMSHEIRTPMSAILGMLRLLNNTSLTTRQRDYAGKAEVAARSLLGLLDDILDFSKVEAGKMQLDPRPFRLDRLLRDLAAIVSAQVGEKHLELLFDIDPAVPAGLIGDDMRLQQVLVNLGGNAIKFTAEGEVVVRVRLIERRGVAIELEFAVRDTGIGIAAEQLEHVFGGFSQAEASTTRRFGGSGLGLAISRRLVGLMGGELQLDSAPGRGSSFHFRITLGVIDADAGDIRLAAPELTALRTLIVDDHPTARAVLAGMIRSFGWSADTVGDGAEAIRLVAQHAGSAQAYQAIFVDARMPAMDGWATSRRLRQIAGPTDPPQIVMLSVHGYDGNPERAAGDEAHIDALLTKPVTPSMLFDAIADARSSLRLPRAVPSGTGQRRLAGMRLLVVEDNLNNQQIAAELLHAEGAQVELAGNGALGLAAVIAADPPFDAVLMDIQMPVMDGYTATARIRQTAGFATLPIIAMTANALASDREACLAAGMNDHIGKPFDLSQLVATLRQHVGRASAAAATRQGHAGVSAELAAEARREGFGLAAAIDRLGGDAAVYLRVIEMFLNDIASLPEQLAAHLRQGELREANRLMHTLKGLAGTVGAERLATRAAAAEKQLTAELPGDLHDALPAEWRREIDDTATALQRFAKRLAGDAAPQAAASRLDDAALRRTLVELSALLDNGDMGATDLHARLHREAPQLASAMAPLDAAMAALDFSRALAHCEALARELDR